MNDEHEKQGCIVPGFSSYKQVVNNFVKKFLRQESNYG